jgi:hypothetical protein
MRRGGAYRGPSGWVLTRLTCVFRLNRVVLVDRGGSSILLRARQHRAGNHAEDRLQDVEQEWDLHEELQLHRHRGAAEQRCRPRPRGTPLRQGGGSSPHYDGSEQLEPGQHSDGQPIGSAPTQGVTVPVINGAVPISPPERHDRL